MFAVLLGDVPSIDSTQRGQLIKFEVENLISPLSFGPLGNFRDCPPMWKS
jgi:hypothetical protein